MTSLSNENLSPQVLRNVAKELNSLQNEPCGGIKVFINDGDLTDIQACLEGPVGTPYENGVFKMKLVLPKEFPQSPPQGYFLTKIFHPNVSKNGEICVNTLKRDWKTDLGLRHILITIRCLLIHPNPESALNEEAGKLLLEDYEQFKQQAQMFTEIYAQKNKTEQSGSHSECPKNSKECLKAASSGATSNTGASKKRAGDKLLDKKKLEKKRQLKRL